MTAEPSSPLHVLKISDVYFPRINGVSTSIETFRRELCALGHRVSLVAPRYPAQTDDGDGDVHRVASRYLPLDPEDRIMGWRTLGRALSAIEGPPPDLVHVHTPFLAHYAGLRLGRELGVPVLATYHTFFEEYLCHYLPGLPPGALRSLARGFSRRQCNALDRVVVPSRAMAERLAAYGVVSALEIVPTGLAPDVFRRGDGERFRRRLGLGPEIPVLLSVGRMAHEKNVDFLLRSMARVAERVPGAILVLAGEGPALPHLRRLARRLGIGARVRFVGYLDRRRDLPDCYRSADAFVFASRTETQGLVLLEAMAQGVPVISTSVMGTRDIVGPQRGAVAVPECEQAFAEAVQALLGEPQRRRRLGAEAAAFAAEWRAGVMARRLEGLYRAVLRDHRDGRQAVTGAAGLR